MEHILAVDGGGTKCEALLMTVEGDAQAFAAVSPGQVSTVGDFGRGRNATAARTVLLRVLNRVNPRGVLHVVFGSGAVVNGEIRNDLKAAHVLFWNASEDQSARCCAGVQDALVALSGTGAFGHLFWSGRHWHADGLGPLIGDWGSAYQIGREGLRAAVRSTIHPGRKTALRDELARIMNVGESGIDLEDVMIHEGIRVFADRTAVARYATMVDRVARNGDEVAIGIIEQAANDLAETLRWLVKSNGVEGESLPFVGSGGVIANSDIYWNALAVRVAELMPRGLAVRQRMPQAVGLALAGLEQAIDAGVLQADRDMVRERLLNSFPAARVATNKDGAI